MSPKVCRGGKESCKWLNTLKTERVQEDAGSDGAGSKVAYFIKLGAYPTVGLLNDPSNKISNISRTVLSAICAKYRNWGNPAV